MKYKKKPIIIEAMQWSGHWETVPDVAAFCGKENVNERHTPTGTPRTYLFIKTLNGDVLVSPKDYIIKGVKGEFYPCKPDIFQQTYEKAGE